MIRTLIVAAAVTCIAIGSNALAQQPPSGAAKIAAHRAPVANREPLEKTPFIRLPIGSVRPEGWLGRQLDLQKDGLTGSSELIYDALRPDSGWLGGEGEGWEKGPYYFKGLLALAHTIDNPTLIERARKWIDWTLENQRDDGWFGPASNDDWWPRMVVLFALRDHYEATGDARVIPFLKKYFQYQLKQLPGRPLHTWGRARAGDNIDIALWTYNLTGDKAILELVKLLREQAYPWSSIFADNRFYGFGDDFHPHHIVNVTQAMKTPPVVWQFSHDEADRKAFAAGVANLTRQYGRADGQFSGTEMLSGLASTDGVELCADVERIISNGIALTILGDADLGDQLEKVAYNSLPAHTSPKMRQITYYQLMNQVTARNGGHGFKQDYHNGIVPGPHSGFPCCCYNWHAGWPKFVQSMWAGTSDGGVALLAYGPNRLNTNLNGTPVEIVQTTDYPFHQTVTLSVSPKTPAAFPLVLRVPGWCEGAEIKVNGAIEKNVKPGAFHRIERTWNAGDKIEIRLPMKVRTSTWVNDSVALERGPLTFGLKIDEEWKRVRDYPGEFDEYEVHPRSAWNYALQVDRASPKVEVEERPVPAVPFATEEAPIVLKVTAKQLPGWGIRKGNGRVVLGKSDHDWNQLADAPVTLDEKESRTVRVVVKGKMIDVFVDDMSKPVLTHQDASFAKGSVGLRTYESDARFDDVKLNGKLVADFADAKSADAWKRFSGKWNVENGEFVTRSARDGKTLYTGASDLTDFTWEATLRTNGGDAGLLFRATDASDRLDGYRGYYVGFSGDASFDAAEPPMSPVTSSEAEKTVELIPFGSTKLRVTYFPWLK